MSNNTPRVGCCPEHHDPSTPRFRQLDSRAWLLAQVRRPAHARRAWGRPEGRPLARRSLPDVIRNRSSSRRRARQARISLGVHGLFRVSRHPDLERVLPPVLLPWASPGQPSRARRSEQRVGHQGGSPEYQSVQTRSTPAPSPRGLKSNATTLLRFPTSSLFSMYRASTILAY